MAQQSHVKRPATVREEAPAPTPRPRGKAAKVFDYSKFRQSIREDRDFAVFLAGYPNKTGILAYIYRLKPVIDNALAGISESSIYKTSTPAEMTQEFIGSKFGRGRYMLRLTDANRPKGETDVCKTWFQIDDPDLTPIYDPRTLKLGDPENQDEIARLLQLGVLIRDGGTGQPRLRNGNDEMAPPAAAASNGHSNGSGDIISKELLGQAFLKLVSAGSQSPGESVKQALEMAKMFQQPAATPQLSPDQLAELVAAKLERSTNRTTADGDFIQTYERFDAFIQKVRGPASSPSALPDNAPAAMLLADKILGHLTMIVPAVFTGLQALQAQRASQPRPGKRIAAGNAHQQQNGGQPEMTIADRIIEISKLGFEKMQQGVNGHDYAAYVCNFIPGGLEIFRMLESQGPGGPSAVMGLAAMNPNLAPYLATPEKRSQVENFLVEFMEFDADHLGATEAPPPNAAGAAAGAAA